VVHWLARRSLERTNRSIPSMGCEVSWKQVQQQQQLRFFFSARPCTHCYRERERELYQRTHAIVPWWAKKEQVRDRRATTGQHREHKYDDAMKLFPCRSNPQTHCREAEWVTFESVRLELPNIKVECHNSNLWTPETATWRRHKVKLYLQFVHTNFERLNCFCHKWQQFQLCKKPNNSN